MSKASPQVVAYLTKQLGRNPIHQSTDIVALRAKAFKLEAQAPVAAKPAAATGDRQKLRNRLEKLRSECFTGGIEPMLAQLDRMPLADFPDLAALAARLRVILESRSRLPQLSTDSRFDGDFFACLKKVLTSPSRDVSVLREQVLSSFRHKRNRKRGQAMIRLIKSELPDLYALEADWFDSLTHYKASKHTTPIKRQATSTQSGQSERSNYWWVLIFLILPLLRAANRYHESTKDDTPKSRSSYSQPYQRTYTPPPQPSPRGSTTSPSTTNSRSNFDDIMRRAQQDVDDRQSRLGVEKTLDDIDRRHQEFLEETQRQWNRNGIGPRPPTLQRPGPMQTDENPFNVSPFPDRP